MTKLPEGFTAVTPMLIVKNAKEAAKFYEDALGMKLLNMMEDPQHADRVMHATLDLNGAKFFLSDEYPEQGAVAPGYQSFYVYYDDVDAAYKQAVAAGMESQMEPTDMFWGDRMASVKDKNGYKWALAKFVKEMSEDEMTDARKEQMGS